MKLRAVIVALAAAAATSATVLVAGQPAFAADTYTVNGTCGSGPPAQTGYGVCLYWGQNYDGARSNLDTLQISNLPVSGTTNLVYVSSGSGHGQYLGNNNGSVANYEFNCYATLFYNTNLTGWSVKLSMWGGDGVYPWQLKGSQQGNLLNNIRSLKIDGCRAF